MKVPCLTLKKGSSDQDTDQNMKFGEDLAQMVIYMILSNRNCSNMQNTSFFIFMVHKFLSVELHFPGKI